MWHHRCSRRSTGSHCAAGLTMHHVCASICPYPPVQPDHWVLIWQVVCPPASAPHIILPMLLLHARQLHARKWVRRKRQLGAKSVLHAAGDILMTGSAIWCGYTRQPTPRWSHVPSYHGTALCCAKLGNMGDTKPAAHTVNAARPCFSLPTLPLPRLHRCWLERCPRLAPCWRCAGVGRWRPAAILPHCPRLRPLPAWQERQQGITGMEVSALDCTHGQLQVAAVYAITTRCTSNPLRTLLTVQTAHVHPLCYICKPC